MAFLADGISAVRQRFHIEPVDEAPWDTMIKEFVREQGAVLTVIMPSVTHFQPPVRLCRGHPDGSHPALIRRSRRLWQQRGSGSKEARAREAPKGMPRAGERPSTPAGCPVMAGRAPDEVIEEVRLFAAVLRDKYLSRSKDDRWAVVTRAMQRVDQQTSTWMKREVHLIDHLGEPQEIIVATLEGRIPHLSEVK